MKIEPTTTARVTGRPAAGRQKTKEHGKSNLHAEEDFLQKIESLNLDPRLKKLLLTYEEVFGALPPPPPLVETWSRWT